MENKNLTAVDWFAKQVEENLGWYPVDIIKEAKQMEEEQSKQDYDAGLFDGTMVDVKDRLYKNAEQYYNETYGKE